jgi:vacuolar protein sorting-associated protein 54
LKLVVLIPHLSQDTVRNLLDLVKKYNSRSTQLILGAGLTRSAGVKHITAKHLSISSESLNIVITMLPLWKSLVQRHVANNAALVSEFDHTAEELQSHRQEIHRKFVSLMSDKVNFQCRAIATTDWSKPIDGPAHKYMQDLIRDTSVLVKILCNILPKLTAVQITSQIFDVFKQRLLEAYTAYEFKSADEKRNMVQDVMYFREKVAAIEGSGNAAEVIYENVNAIPTPSEDKSAPAPPVEKPAPEGETMFDADIDDE